MIIEWSPMARASARRYIADQAGLRSISAAVSALLEDPVPADGFHSGEYHRLRVGKYRIIYVLDDQVITVSRVDRVVS